MCNKNCKRCGGGLPDWMMEDIDWLPEGQLVPPGENEVDCSIDNVRIELDDPEPDLNEIRDRLDYIQELVEQILDNQVAYFRGTR